MKVDQGLALVPGTDINQLVENFEGHFGPVRYSIKLVMPQYNFLMCLRAWFPVMSVTYAYRSAVGLLYA